MNELRKQTFAEEEEFLTADKTVQFTSVQSFDRLGRRGDMKNGSAEILFQAFL